MKRADNEFSGRRELRTALRFDAPCLAVESSALGSVEGMVIL